MAKIVIYFHAKKGRINELIRACKNLSSNKLIVSKKIEIAVMKPCSPDILAVPSKSAFLETLDLVLEIVAPLGASVESIRQELKIALSPVLDLADNKKSYLAYGYHRTFQESGEKPQRYHYLMYRRDDYGRADYMDYYTNHHYQFGIATPLADYYQNYLEIEGGAAIADLFGVQPITADSISELRFENIEAYLSSDTIRKVAPAAAIDETKFVNREVCQSFSMDVIIDTRDY